jgi:hypothetical protein
MMAFATPVFAADECVKPAAPKVPSGSSATKEQLLAARSDVQKFIKSADDYMDCVNLVLVQAREKATADKKDVDPALVTDTTAKVNDMQKLKETVGNEMNKSISVYLAAHPADNSKSAQ